MSFHCVTIFLRSWIGWRQRLSWGIRALFTQTRYNFFLKGRNVLCQMRKCVPPLRLLLFLRLKMCQCFRKIINPFDIWHDVMWSLLSIQIFQSFSPLIPKISPEIVGFLCRFGDALKEKRNFGRISFGRN